METGYLFQLLLTYSINFVSDS